MYIELELYPDAPKHDVLGLTRVHHRNADPLITLTAGAPLMPTYTGSRVGNSAALAIGCQWTLHNQTERLANFTYSQVKTSHSVTHCSTSICDFSVVYNISSTLSPQVVEHYLVKPDQVIVTASLSQQVDVMSILFPAFQFDGIRESLTRINQSDHSVRHPSIVFSFEAHDDSLDLRRIPCDRG